MNSCHAKEAGTKTANTLVKFARELIDLSMNMEAEILLRQVIRRDPLCLPAYRLLGYALEAQYRWEDAMDVFGVVKQIHSWKAGARALVEQ